MLQFAKKTFMIEIANHGGSLSVIERLRERWEDGVNKMGHFEKMLENFLQKLVDYIPNLIATAIILLLGYLASKIVKRVFKKISQKTKTDGVAEKYLSKAASAAVWFLTIVMAMDKLGIPVGSVLTLFAAVGAAVALAVKDNLANLASGIVLLFTKPFNAGDLIGVNGQDGVIREICMMHTYIDTLDNVQIAVPNTAMMSATIKNYSAHNNRRHDFKISVAYSADVKKAKELLLTVAKNCPLVVDDPEAPQAFVESNAESSIVLCLRLWTATADYLETEHRINEEIKRAMDDGGIEIPFNQLDVHLN